MSQSANNEVESIVQHTRKVVTLLAPENVGSKDQRSLFAVPEGVALEWRDAELASPMRAQGTRELHDADSFMTYTIKHSADDDSGFETALYCDADFRTAKAQFTAVLNEIHGSVGAYRDFRATYAPRITEEWSRWMGANKKEMSQVDFAMFLEENVRDIAQVGNMPSGSEMLTLALSLEASQDLRIKSSVRLSSGGVNLEYVNDQDAATAKRMELYERFMLGIPPYLNGQAYQVEARLRYRIKGGGITFWYEMIRPDMVIADAIRGEIAKIEEGTTIKVLFGKP